MALGTNLPFWPAMVFTYLEPLSELLGAHAAFSDPISFTERQLPVSLSLTPPPPTAILLAYSLGSLFLMLAALNILCTAVTRDLRTTRYYLTMLACGDMGHMFVNYVGMGSEVFWDFSSYNEVMVGNVAITMVLWTMRVLTLRGAFGRLGREVKR